ncbi:MAG: hypothetical protein IT259_05830 [Saprospiraceae bacterium]|nr:hypothetical protein [Saprospiraceae bacterium]
MKYIKETAPFAYVIFLGIAIFLLDLFEFSSESARKGILIPVALFKASYFLYLLISRLRKTAGQQFFFYQFANFIALSVLLVVVSFSLDYYCFYRIDASSFSGIPPGISTLKEFLAFFYFSVSTFTTAGLGDITPRGSLTQVLVALQLSIGWLTTVLVIGNIAHLREDLTQRH